MNIIRRIFISLAWAMIHGVDKQEHNIHKAKEKLISPIKKGVRIALLAALMMKGVDVQAGNPVTPSSANKPTTSTQTKKPVPTNKTKQLTLSKTSRVMIDTTNHEAVITADVNDLIAQYGKVRGLEIVNQHAIVELNKFRAMCPREVNPNKDAPPLVYHPILQKSSQTYAEYAKANRYSAEIDSIGYFPHEDHEGTHSRDRIIAAGGNFDMMEENLGWGAHSIKRMCDYRFYESPSHRKAILNPKTTYVGIGYEQGPGKTFRVANFGGYRK